MKKVALSFILIAAAILVQAQNLEKLVFEADKAFFNEEFELAFNKYEYISHLFPKEKKINYHKQIAYLLTEGRGESIESLLAYAPTRGVVDKFYKYWLGRVYLNHYEFDLAEQNLKEFLALKVYKSEIIVNETKYFLNVIRNARNYYEDPDNYEIDHLPASVNSEFSELSPVFSRDNSQLFYFSSKPVKSSYNPGEYYLYGANKTDNYSTPEVLEIFGKYDRASAKIELTHADQALFVYDDKKEEFQISNRENDRWTTPSEYDKNIKKAELSSHFFVSEDGNQILFVSDNGGSLDIYHSLRNEAGEWEYT